MYPATCGRTGNRGRTQVGRCHSLFRGPGFPPMVCPRRRPPSSDEHEAQRVRADSGVNQAISLGVVVGVAAVVLARAEAGRARAGVRRAAGSAAERGGRCAVGRPLSTRGARGTREGGRRIAGERPGRHGSQSPVVRGRARGTHRRQAPKGNLMCRSCGCRAGHGRGWGTRGARPGRCTCHYSLRTRLN